MKKYDRDQAEKYTRVFGKLVDLHDLYVANKREIKEKDKKEIENLFDDLRDIPEELKIKKFKQQLEELEQEYNRK
ncbi:hypothetical protein J4465_00115 [Candidatus Pacearchaeota archaeon]|nr:hypothetical protein [Candidatus Pacearchaeota archaeon]